MEHSHSHHHEHSAILKNVSTAFTVGIILNFAFVIIEVIAGLHIHSLSLLADAGHNLADVGALALSLLAFKLLKVKATDEFTYGYRKTSILVALFNGVVLLISIGAIVYEAIQRFYEQQPVEGISISIVAGAGIIINAVTALMFYSNKKHDLNVKSAYLHLMSDAVISFGIVIGGIVIYYTGWFWMDSVLSIVIATAILYSTWHLLRESLRLSLDGVPVNIKVNELKLLALNIAGVKDLHHIHVWAISTTENALTAHLVFSKDTSKLREKEIKQQIRHLFEHNHINHITLETEWEDEACMMKSC